MKKAIITAITAILAIVAFSQPAQAQFKYGPKVGINYNALDEGKEIVNSSACSGLTAGIMAELTIPVIGPGLDAYAKTGLPEFYAECNHPFVSTHPMFGPTFASLTNLANENAIIIKEGDYPGKVFFSDLYRRLNLNIEEDTFEEHDETSVTPTSCQTTENLAVLRQQIDAIDNELVELLSKRMRISREIGQYKKEHGMPVLQMGRHDEIMHDRVRLAQEMGMDGDFMRTLFSVIHDESVRQQVEIFNNNRNEAKPLL